MQSMLSSLSDLISPFMWYGLDVLWLLVGVLLLVKIKGKASLAFFLASLLSVLLSTINMIDTYSYNWNSDGIISWEKGWHYLVFDFGWALLYFTMIISIGFLSFRTGALIKRNRELEDILSSR